MVAPAYGPDVYIPWSAAFEVDAVDHKDYLQFMDIMLRSHGVVRPEEMDLKTWEYQQDIVSIDARDLLAVDSLLKRRLTNAEKRKYRAEHLTMYPAKWLAWAYSTVLAVLFWTVVLYKIYADGFDAFYHFFTNWMLTYNAIWYLLDSLSYLDPTGKMQSWLVLLVWWPYFGNVGAVFILVFPLKGINPEIIIETAQMIGWKATLLGEEIVHVATLFLDFGWFLLRSQDVVDVLAQFPWDGERQKLYFAFYWLLTMLNANLVIAAYCSSFDFHRVYGVDVNNWLCFIGIEIIYLVFVGFPVIYYAPIGLYLRKDAYRREIDPLDLVETGLSFDELEALQEQKRLKKLERTQEEDEPVVIEMSFPAGTLLINENVMQPAEDYAGLWRRNPTTYFM